MFKNLEFFALLFDGEIVCLHFLCSLSVVHGECALVSETKLEFKTVRTTFGNIKVSNKRRMEFWMRK